MNPTKQVEPSTAKVQKNQSTTSNWRNLKLTPLKECEMTPKRPTVVELLVKMRRDGRLSEHEFETMMQQERHTAYLRAVIPGRVPDKDFMPQLPPAPGNRVPYEEPFISRQVFIPARRIAELAGKISAGAAQSVARVAPHDRGWRSHPQWPR